MMTLLIDSIFSSVALGHLMVDLLNGSRPVLLAFLSKSLGLTNTSLALISTIYVWAASITQPVFGWLRAALGGGWRFDMDDGILFGGNVPARL
jgi:MFS family permease